MMTREEALAIYHAGPETVVRVLLEMSATIDALEKRVAELEKKVAELSRNSSNSSKPPSSDDITKPRAKRKRKGKRKIGAQPGHQKHERIPFDQDELDDFYEYKLERCPDCGGKVSLRDWEPRRIQQVELKEVVVTKEEHCAYAFWCAHCQKTHYHPFPPEALPAGLFKERLTALVVYMKYVNHASFSTIRKFLRDVLGVKVSRGLLSKTIQKTSQALEKPYEELLHLLPFEQKLNVDETGHKENGEKFWTWVFKADLYVLFKIDKSRGSKVLLDVLGQEFNGVLGCDFFSAYRKYMKDFNILVQFCLAHLIRDIKFLSSLTDTQTKAYGQKLLAAVKDMFHLIHHRKKMSKAAFHNALEKARKKILRIGIQHAPSCLDGNGKQKHPPAQNMADRFRHYGEAYFRFITTPGIEPTNNSAEQAFRFVVINRTVTQGTRSSKGRTASERLWTVIATCKLQGRSAFNFILRAVRAGLHNLQPPSLLPETLAQPP